MKVKIEPSIATGEIKAPPSKSYAHRLLIASALAEGQCSVSGIINSKDMEATLNCISALGVSFNRKNDVVSLTGGIKESDSVRKFNCNESGSTLRFFIPIALALGGTNEFCGTERLISRGVSVYEKICKSQGIEINKESDKLVFNGKLKSGDFYVSGDISSQFITGLLFALPLLDGDSTINITTELESAGYVDITIDVLERYGIKVERRNNSFFVKGNQKYTPSNQAVEGDMSNAAFLDAFNVIGGNVSVVGLNPLSKQGDSVYAPIMVNLKYTAPKIDLSGCPDLAPVLFAVAAACNGAEFIGTRRLKIKESDRAEAMARELCKLGIKLDIYENSVVVHKGQLIKPTEPLYGHNDHRIVMALSVILSICGGEIYGCEAIEKSYPNFFADLKSLGIKCEVTE